MASEWYCDVRGNKVGPLSPQQLLELVRIGDVTVTTRVRKNDSSWFRADEVSGLFEAAFRDQEGAWGGPQTPDQEYEY